VGRTSSTCAHKLQTGPLVREGASQEENRKCQKIVSMEVEKKFIAGPGRWPGTRTDWPVDRRS
jgi:hypothetical protein